MTYDLALLGWHEFERLTDLIAERELGVARAWWHGHADAGRHARAPEGGSWRGRELPGPLLVISRFAPKHGPGLIDLAKLVKERAAREPMRGPILLLTNLSLDEHLGPALVQLCGLPGGDRLTVVGAEELGAILDSSPDLRLALPSVLGVRREPAPTDGPHAGRLDLDGARAVARVFVPTRAYARAVGILGRHRFCVLTGPPEMGKTAIARVLALARQAEGYDALDVRSPDELLRAFDPARRQIFVADDTFGSTEYRPDAAERWARDLPAVLRRLLETGRHELIWTSRPAPLRAGLARVHRERGLERFPSPGEVQVDAAALDATEKAVILVRHALGAGLPRDVRSQLAKVGREAVEHPHFTPERIRRLVAGLATPEGRHLSQQLKRTLSAALARPTDAMAASFGALDPEHRAALTAMLDQPPGPVEERELLAAMRRIDPGAHRHAPAELLDHLAEHFLRPAHGRWEWVHPSWRDIVIEHLAEDAQARQRFLAGCSIYGLALALSAAGGASGERVLPLLISDADWDLLGDRLVQLARHGHENEVAHVLVALTAGLSMHGRRARAGAELRALAESVLTAMRLRWAHAPAQAIPLDMLEHWFELRTVAAAEVEPPDLAATWADLLPAGPVRPRDPEEVERFDDWSALVWLLALEDRSQLERLGWPGRWRALILDTLDIRDEDLHAPHELRHRLADVLRRFLGFREIGSQKVTDALMLLGAVNFGHEPRREPPPRHRPVIDPDAVTVERVLSDLR